MFLKAPFFLITAKCCLEAINIRYSYLFVSKVCRLVVTFLLISQYPSHTYSLFTHTNKYQVGHLLPLSLVCLEDMNQYFCGINVWMKNEDMMCKCTTLLLGWVLLLFSEFVSFVVRRCNKEWRRCA